MERLAEIRLLKSIHDVQTRFIDDAEPREVFDNLLAHVLSLSESEYGFIGEVQHRDREHPYLKIRAITNVAWNEETRRFYEEQAPEGMEFHNMNTLFGAVITGGKPVVANRPDQDPRRGGTPSGHPKLKAFLGLPLFRQQRLIGMIGVANRPGGYDETLITFLRPLVTTCESIVSAYASARERQAAELELLESEDRYRRLVEDLPGLLCRFKPDGTLTLVNSAYASYFGSTTAECEGSDLFNLIPPSDRDAVRRHFAELSRERPIARIEHQVIAPGGEVRWMQWTNRALFDAKDRVIELQSVGLDITDRKRAEQDRHDLEEQMRQVQKLESLGVLAGGIAHDFNNLLTTIVGNASLALAELADDSSVRAQIAQIETASLRAADLCRQMLAYSGRGRFVIETVNLCDLVEEMLSMLEMSISKKATLHVDAGQDDTAAEVDATQIRQVVMNLITNASDALGDRPGVIEIRTGSMECARTYLRDTFVDDNLAAGRYAFIEVSDTGCGMTEEASRRMFDPFYTTKFAGRGLGMAAVLGIVRGHRGAIRIESTPGRGTVVRVLFPVSEAKVGVKPDRQTRTEAAPGSGTILVVDDDEGVRTLIRLSLEQVGYDVVSASDGEEALELFRDRHHEISAVVLDLTMPRLGGDEVLSELRGIEPDTKVILASGYDGGEVQERLVDNLPAAFLSKPFKPRELLSTLRRVLGSESRAEE